jgi:hypothetical protein
MHVSARARAARVYGRACVRACVRACAHARACARVFVGRGECVRGGETLMTAYVCARLHRPDSRLLAKLQPPRPAAGAQAHPPRRWPGPPTALYPAGPCSSCPPLRKICMSVHMCMCVCMSVWGGGGRGGVEDSVSGGGALSGAYGGSIRMRCRKQGDVTSAGCSHPATLHRPSSCHRSNETGNPFPRPNPLAATGGAASAGLTAEAGAVRRERAADDPQPLAPGVAVLYYCPHVRLRLWGVVRPAGAIVVP